MDGVFACPECGSSVEVEGLAPGRQARCPFCHRLLEVPYLPRVPAGRWKRRRFGSWKWVRWAWMGVAAVAALALILPGIRFLGRQYRSARETPINQLLMSSKAHEAEGRLDQALVDLDAALDLVRRLDETARSHFETERHHRPELARREVQAALERLAEDRRNPYPLGEWLNLLDRGKKDPDIAPLRSRIQDGFRRSVRVRSTKELESAKADRDSGRVVGALNACDRIAALLPYLDAGPRDEMRHSTGELVDRLVMTHGVALEAPRGDFVLSSHDTYRATLLPVLVKALEAKGFLPYRETSAWKAAWEKAAYQIRLHVSERREGNYESTENRLTRIEAHLTLCSSSRVVWETMPTARTTVPVPGLTAFQASRLAINRSRSDEFERFLYDNARSQIDARFSQALSHMPACCP